MAMRMRKPPMKVARAGSSFKTIHANTGCTGTSRLLTRAASLEGRSFEPSLNRIEAMEKTSPKSAKIRISGNDVVNGCPQMRAGGMTNTEDIMAAPAAGVAGYLRKIERPIATEHVIHKAKRSPPMCPEPKEPAPITITPAKARTLAANTILRGRSRNHSQATNAVRMGALP